ncbi:hypothetical protein MsAg5_06290 [Methanosarcinaceae archaeon Ag5]|uniref:GLUG domain-containing protein n=1 Tax=Methanolapillus africanus TaxID=3028297 RepID=A0AAE4MIF5_9EURY|nr:hypothetical protein [Methanosarcinaceae archaeon Ag5]
MEKPPNKTILIVVIVLILLLAAALVAAWPKEKDPKNNSSALLPNGSSNSSAAFDSNHISSNAGEKGKDPVLANPSIGGREPPIPPTNANFTAKLYDYNEVTHTLRLLVQADQEIGPFPGFAAGFENIGTGASGNMTVRHEIFQDSPDMFLVSITGVPLNTPGDGQVYTFSLSEIRGSGTGDSVCYPFDGGNGTDADNAFEIANIVQFDALRYYAGSSGEGKYFKLVMPDETYPGFDANVFVMPPDWNNESAAVQRGYSDGKFWQPVGSAEKPFSGTFDGNGILMDSFDINRPDADYMGIFGVTASGSVLKNVTVTGTIMTGKDYVGGLAAQNNGLIDACSVRSEIHGKINVGGVAGVNSGTISNSEHVANIVSGNISVGGVAGVNSGTISQSHGGRWEGLPNTSGIYGYEENVGGIAGVNMGSGSISDSYFVGSVTGVNSVGGLAGKSSAGISNCYATGSTIIGTGSDIGGAIGTRHDGTLSNITAVDAVHSPLGSNVGGLIGNNTGDFDGRTVSGATYLSGGVTGKNYVGGLIGFHGGGSVHDVISSGPVTGNSSVGGLVGYNNASIANSTANGAVTGNASVGGIAGTNNGPGTISASFTNGYTVTGNGDDTGGLVGLNFGTVSNSYSCDPVTGVNNVGGIAGSNYKTVSNCYVYYAPVSASGNYAGGIVGFSSPYAPNRIQNCTVLFGLPVSSGSESTLGRITGNFDPSQTTLSNNYGTDGRGKNPAGSGWVSNISGKDGASNTYDPEQSLYESIGWDFGPAGFWVWGGNYPVLRWPSAI